MITCIHQKYENDNICIAAPIKDGKLTDNTSDKDISNSQFQEALSQETSSKPLPDKGNTNYSKMKIITFQ